MSDEDKESKTEEASEKRKDEMRKEGKVPQSQDVVAAAALLGAVAALAMIMPTMARDFAAVTIRAMRLVDANDPLNGLKAAVGALLGMLAPLVGAAVLAVVAGLAQTRGLFSIELALPKGERFDPLPKLKQMLPGKDSALELGKSLLKIFAVGMVVWKLLEPALPQLLALGGEDAEVAADTVAGIAVKMLMYATGCYAVIAAIDFALAQHKFAADSRMSKQEMKEEFKQDEQDPGLKRKMRQRGREILAQAKAGDLKTATVVVTNPTHFAVALRYDTDRDAVPVVIAKAVDEAALRMRKQARGYRIPIVENRPLARALHKIGKVGKPIPAEMYRAVAEIIAHVLRLRSGARP